MTLRSIVPSLVCIALLPACGDGSGTSREDITPPTPAAEQRLRQVDGADEFVAALREALRRQWGGYGGPVYEVDDVAVDAGGAESADADGGASDGGAGLTGTNVQEIGVDEADRIKSDGRYLYVLDNRRDGYGPVWGEPVPLEEGELAIIGTDGDADASARDSLPCCASGAETRLRVLALDPSAPDATGLASLTLDLDDREADGMYLAGNGQTLYVLSKGLSSFWGFWGEPAAFGGVNGLLRAVDVRDPERPVVTGRLSIDGQIVASRRIDNRLFIASRFSPRLPNIDPWAVSQEDWNRAVDAADIGTLLPDYRRDGDGAADLIDPASCFVAAGALDPYLTPDVITLSVFDLDDLSLSDSECYLGASETLYASTEAVYLATTRWSGEVWPVDLDSPVADITFADPRTDTDIHRFAIDGGDLAYTGSGRVRGHLGWNEARKPWRLSDRDGYLRVATINDRLTADRSPVLMTVFDTRGGDLDLVATLPNPAEPAFLGKPGEQLYASRFVGDKAYLVTFRATDPLYVVDLADPRAPRVAGELEIEGYSDYLHPVGDDMVLGIGKDAVPAEDRFGDGRGAWTLGVKLALFDVSDPNAPREVQSLVVGQRGSEAGVLYDHRAVTVQPATDAHPMRVLFGVEVAGRAEPVSRPIDPWTWYSWNYSGLHGFEVRSGADAGITAMPPLVIARAGAGDPRPNLVHGAGADRALMVGDAVYYVPGADVYAARWPDLGTVSGPR